MTPHQRDELLNAVRRDAFHLALKDHYQADYEHDPLPAGCRANQTTTPGPSHGWTGCGWPPPPGKPSAGYGSSPNRSVSTSAGNTQSPGSTRKPGKTSA